MSNRRFKGNTIDDPRQKNSRFSGKPIRGSFPRFIPRHQDVQASAFYPFYGSTVSYPVRLGKRPLKARSSSYADLNSLTEQRCPRDIGAVKACRPYSLVLSVLMIFLALFSGTILSSEPPVVTQFSPSTGSVGSGITISGENFIEVISIKFNQTVTTNFSVLGGQIGVSVPSGASTGPITVVTSAGSVTSAGIFLVLQTGVPIILGFSPQEGPPGTVLTVSGDHFGDISAVMFNDVPASAFTLIGSQISVTVPKNATTGPIAVVNPSGSGVSSQSFKVIVVTPPVVQEFSPTSGSVGTLVTINGLNFVSVLSVKFGDVEALGFSPVGSQISASVPPGAKSGHITVTTATGSGNSEASFFVTDAPPPSIVSFSPANGPPGTRVTITGTFFKDTSTVLFNGKQAAFLLFGNQLFATVPEGASSGPISVTTPTGTSASPQPFNVNSSQTPRIIDFSPTNGPVGTILTIKGENLTDITSVRIGGSDASFNLLSSPNITATVPQQALTGPVEIFTAAGKAVSSTSFFVAPAPGPRITSFSPESGPAGGIIIVTGENLQGTSSAKLGDVEVSFLVFGNQIFLTLPPEARSGFLTITTPAGSSRSDRPFLIGNLAPTILEFTPIKGAAGDLITLVGSNLAGILRVDIGGAEAPIVSLSGSEIQVKVPRLAKSGPLELTSADGTFQTSVLFVVLPQITGFIPASGTGGEVILIEGAGFHSVEKVEFQGAPAKFELLSSTQIKATVPDQSSTGPILVKTLTGEAISTSRFSYIVPIPKEVPAITFLLLGNGKLELSWLNSNPAFLLESTSELGTLWSAETSPAVIVSGRRQVQFETTVLEKRFFRLISPP